MNTSGLGSSSKRAVLDTSNGAGSVSMVFLASPLFGLLRVLGSGEVRPFAANQGGSLLSLGFLGSDLAKPGLSNLLSGFVSANVLGGSGKVFSVLTRQMLRGGQALKVFNSVVSLVVIDVMNMFFGIKPIKPALSHNSMQKTSPANEKVSIFSEVGGKGFKLSENFSATRNGKKVVEESVFGSVYHDAFHVVPSGDCINLILSQTTQKV